MKIHLKALGCRLNEAELEQWSGQFAVKGHQIVKNADEEDIVVLNTCAVTTEATKNPFRIYAEFLQS